MLLRISSFNLILLLVACQQQTKPEPTPAGSLLGLENVDKIDVNLGPFDSKILKISWFRFAQLVGQVDVGGRQAYKAVRWEPQWFGIFSHGWLRDRGARAEAYLAGVPDLKVTFSDRGFPDKDVQRMIKYLILSAHLTEVPDIDASMLTKEWFSKIQKLPVSEESWSREVGLAKILVVESDKGKRIFLHRTLRDNPQWLAKSRKLHSEAAALMATFVPELAGRSVDPAIDKEK